MLFVGYEEMLADLDGVVRRVTAFLGVNPLSDAERAAVVAKCSFRYMKQHQEAFEMHPPTILGTDVQYFIKGTTTRHEDVDPARRLRLARWSAERLAGTAFPLARYYPDVAGARASPNPYGASPLRAPPGTARDLLAEERDER